MSDVLRTSGIDRLLNESSSEDEQNIDFSDDSGEVIEYNEFSDDSAVEGDNGSELETSNFVDENSPEYDDIEFILGKDGETIWCTSEVATTSKTKNKNIIKILPGTKKVAKNAKYEVEAFLSVISLDMIDEILYCTNQHIVSLAPQLKRERDCLQSNRTEVA